MKLVLRQIVVLHPSTGPCTRREISDLAIVAKMHSTPLNIISNHANYRSLQHNMSVQTSLSVVDMLKTL